MYKNKYVLKKKIVYLNLFIKLLRNNFWLNIVVVKYICIM